MKPLAGKALVRLVPVENHTSRQRQLGLLQGVAVLDCDLKTDFQDDIDAMFS